MNSKLRYAIEQAVIIPDRQEFSSAEATAHSFSPKYNKNISKLIKRQKKKYYPLICTTARRVACVIAAFLVISMTTVLSVEAFRKPFFDFIVRLFSSHSEVRGIDDSGDYPEKIESRYEITYDLSEYQIINSNIQDKKINIDYNNGERYIYFTQSVVNGYNADFNTEGAEIEYVDINGIEAMGYLDNQNYYTLIWNNGEYIIDLSSNIGKDALIEIAESVQKRES